MSHLSPVPTGTATAAADRPATRPTLTIREHLVLTLVVDGLTNPQIATQLTNSPRTVQSHVRSLMRKFGATTRTDLAVRALRTHVVPLEVPEETGSWDRAAVSA